MGSYNAPTLVTSIDTDNYRSELNSNFTSIQAALISIENAIPSFGGRSTAGNLSVVDYLVIPDGVIGTDSFIVEFSTDEDEVSIRHDAPNGISACVIGDRYHESNVAWSKALSDVVSGDGTYRLALGAQSFGSPTIELLLEEELTDLTQELTFWTFDVTIATGVYSVTNLRRKATVLIDRQSFDQVFTFQHALTFCHTGALPVAIGDIGIGVIVPWDAMVVGGWVHLSEAPVNTDGGSVTIEIRDSDDTDGQNVFIDDASWAPAEDRTVRQLTADAEPTLVRAGTFLRPWISAVDSGGAGFDLSGTILLQRVYHEIL